MEHSIITSCCSLHHRCSGWGKAKLVPERERIMSQYWNAFRRGFTGEWKRVRKYFLQQLFIVYTCFCATAFLSLAYDSFRTKDGSELTAWQWVQVSATSGFLWITIGGGGILLHWMWKHLKRLNDWYFQECSGLKDAPLLLRHEFILELLIAVLATIFLFCISSGLPLWRQITVTATSPFYFSVMRFGLSCQSLGCEFGKEKTEVMSRKFWGLLSLITIIPPIIGTIMIVVTRS